MTASVLRPLAVAAITLSLVACSRTTDTGTDTSSSSASSSAAVSSARSSTASSARSRSSSTGVSSRSSASSQQQAQVRTITVKAENWEFQPNSISAKKGEKVRLAVVGAEGVHGLAIPGLNINVSVNAGETVYVDIPTDAAGTFDFFCSVPCGPGHRDMKGSVVIS